MNVRLGVLVLLVVSPVAVIGEEPPYKRLLQGDDAAKTATLEEQIDELRQSGKYTEAQAAARIVLELRRRVQGEEHWETCDALRALRTLEHIAALPANAQAELAEAGRLDTEADKLEERGSYAQAIPLLWQILAIRRRNMGEDHFEVAVALNDLAFALNRSAQYAEAETPFRQALATRRKVLGENHPHTANSYNNVAGNLQDQGKYAQAEPLFRQALATRRKVLGEDHPDTAISYNCVAMNLNEQGKYAEAEPLFRQALAIRRSALGEDHAGTATSYNNVAYNLRAQGKYAEAEPLYRQALAIRRKVLGEDHLDTATSYNNVAASLNAQGKCTEAEPLYHQALATRRKILGENHPDTATSYLNVAANLNAQGKCAEAEPLYRQALAILCKSLGEDHPLTATGYKNLAMNLDAQGRHVDAEPLWARAVQIFEIARWRASRTGLERASFTVASPFPYLAACRARLGQPVAAWRALEAGLARGLLDDLSATRTQSLSPDERQRLDALNRGLEQLDRQITALLTSKEQNEADTARYRELAVQRETATAELDRFAADRAAREIYDLEHVQALLPADTALLSWIDIPGHPHAAQPGGEHWACLLRRTGTPIWVRLPGSGPQEAWTEKDDSVSAQLRQTLTEPPDRSHPGWQQLARQAAAQRLAPLEPHLRGVRHLVILSAWAMAGLPVEAFTDRYTVSYAPSATLFARLREQRQQRQTAGDGRLPPPSKLLALGDPTFPPATLVPPQPEVLPPDHGVLLTHVSAASHADQSGLKADDVLLSYAGTKLSSPAELRDAVEAEQKAQLVAKEPSEARVPLQVWRAGKVLNVKVRPGPLGAQLSLRPAAEALLAKRAGDQALQTSRGSAFAPLPGTRIETQAIARLFPESVVLLGADASVQRLAQLASANQLRQYRYLHLATHGIVNHQIALYSALILAQEPSRDAAKELQEGQPGSDGRLTAEMILQSWKLDADLVVLSACQSALGKQAGDEGYLGFAQALFLAGARSLVLSLWKVDDTATELLMVRFYQNLLGKRADLKAPLPKAEALREAKQWLRQLPRTERDRLVATLSQGEQRGAPVTLKGKPVVPAPHPGEQEERPYAHPYYWAAFVLFGEAE